MKLQLFFTGLFFSAALLAAPDEEILGRKDGYPVCPLPIGPTEQRCLVGMYSHYDQIVPARKVAASPAVRALKRAEREPPIRYSGHQSSGSVDDFLAKNRNTGLLVLRGDTVLVERYQYERRPEHRFTSMSMAKTVLAMLVGIAVAEGKIASIDDRADHYVPALKGHPYGETSLRHLLTMSSGVQFREVYDGKDDVTVLARRTLYQQGPGGADTVLPFRQRVRPAGEKFSYASAESQVLGLALRAAIARPIADYLSEKIWQPMGAEADATWLVDAGGHEMGYIGLQATLRDWGRVGLLLANDGALDGRQIIPADWVRAATTPSADNRGYGFQTWVYPGQDRRFMLLGIRGQAVFVHPASKTVVVHTAVHWGASDPNARADQFRFFEGVLKTLEN